MAPFSDNLSDGLAALTGQRKSDAAILREIGDQDPQMRELVAAAMGAQQELGPAFDVAVYRAALAYDFGRLEIPFEANVPVQVRYRGTLLDTGHTADFICFGDTLVSVHAQDAFTTDDNRVFISQLNALDMARGLLLNFSVAPLDFRRAARALDT